MGKNVTKIMIVYREGLNDPNFSQVIGMSDVYYKENNIDGFLTSGFGKEKILKTFKLPEKMSLKESQKWFKKNVDTEMLEYDYWRNEIELFRKQYKKEEKLLKGKKNSKIVDLEVEGN